MRVAYVTPFYNGECDGRFGRFHDWVHTARDLADPPFEVDVYPFTVSNPDELVVTEPRAILGTAAELWGTKLNKPEFVMNADRIRRALGRREYDVLHVLTAGSVVLPTVLSTRPSVPVVLGPDLGGWSPIRAGDFRRETWTDRGKNRFRYALKNVVGRTAPYDRTVAFSEYHRQIQATFGVPRERIALLEPGVDRRFGPGDPPAPRNDPPEVLWVGDFTRHKGYDVFLEALAALDRTVTARLVGAGDPDRDLIADLGLDDVVIVEGFVDRGDLPPYYRRADLFVVASIDEMGPNTQVEALASGTPVVATDRAGINEYPPPAAAVYFWPRERDPLARAIDTAVDDLDAMTGAAMDAHERFHADRTLEGLAGLYEDVVDEA